MTNKPIKIIIIVCLVALFTLMGFLGDLFTYYGGYEHLRQIKINGDTRNSNSIPGNIKTRQIKIHNADKKSTPYIAIPAMP